MDTFHGETKRPKQGLGAEARANGKKQKAKGKMGDKTGQLPGLKRGVGPTVHGAGDCKFKKESKENKSPSVNASEKVEEGRSRENASRKVSCAAGGGKSSSKLSKRSEDSLSPMAMSPPLTESTRLSLNRSADALSTQLLKSLVISGDSETSSFSEEDDSYKQLCIKPSVKANMTFLVHDSPLPYLRRRAGKKTLCADSDPESSDAGGEVSHDEENVRTVIEDSLNEGEEIPFETELEQTPEEETEEAASARVVEEGRNKSWSHTETDGAKEGSNMHTEEEESYYEVEDRAVQVSLMSPGQSIRICDLETKEWSQANFELELDSSGSLSNCKTHPSKQSASPTGRPGKGVETASVSKEGNLPTGTHEDDFEEPDDFGDFDMSALDVSTPNVSVQSYSPASTCRDQEMESPLHDAEATTSRQSLDRVSETEDEPGKDRLTEWNSPENDDMHREDNEEECSEDLEAGAGVGAESLQEEEDQDQEDQDQEENQDQEEEKEEEEEGSKGSGKSSSRNFRCQGSSVSLEDSLPDIDTSPIENDRHCVINPAPGNWRPRRKQSDSSEDEDKLEAFFQKMKTPHKPKEPTAESPDMEDFIVEDWEVSDSGESTDNEDEDEDCVFAVPEIPPPSGPRPRRKCIKPVPTFYDKEESSGSEDEAGTTSDIDDSSSPRESERGAVSMDRDCSEDSVSGTSSLEDRSPLCDEAVGYATPSESAKPTKRVMGGQSCQTTPSSFSFLKSLSQQTPSHCRHPEAHRFVSKFAKHREELVKSLFLLYNKNVFESKLPADLPVIWNKRLRKTAGYCAYKRGPQGPIARVELSTKVCDTAERTRDTLIHELCHAAVWLLNGVNDGHGPHWRHWSRKANAVYPDIPVITRCHDYAVNTKYIYECTKCGYQIGRHSKSLDITKKCCGHCHGLFQLKLASETSGSSGSQTPRTPRTPNKFALYVQANYSAKKKERSDLRHKDIMQMLSKEFASKNRISDSASSQ